MRRGRGEGGVNMVDAFWRCDVGHGKWNDLLCLHIYRWAKHAIYSHELLRSL
jgi:hypothetical protein